MSELLHVSERNVILACMRPDDPPDSVPDHVAFFRCAMASLWILRQGLLKAQDQVQGQQDRQLQEMIGYERPRVVKRNAAAACDAFKEAQRRKAKQREDEAAAADKATQEERDRELQEEERQREKARREQESKRGWLGTLVDRISPFKKPRLREEDE